MGLPKWKPCPNFAKSAAKKSKTAVSQRSFSGSAKLASKKMSGTGWD